MDDLKPRVRTRHEQIQVDRMPSMLIYVAAQTLE